jgi:hypothetical protein
MNALEKAVEGLQRQIQLLKSGLIPCQRHSPVLVPMFGQSRVCDLGHSGSVLANGPMARNSANSFSAIALPPFCVLNNHGDDGAPHEMRSNHEGISCGGMTRGRGQQSGHGKPAKIAPSPNQDTKGHTLERRTAWHCVGKRCIEGADHGPIAEVQRHGGAELSLLIHPVFDSHTLCGGHGDLTRRKRALLLRWQASMHGRHRDRHHSRSNETSEERDHKTVGHAVLSGCRVNIADPSR